MADKSTKKNTSRIVYYHDELNDEFSKAQITAKKIDGSYKYDKTSGIYKIPRFFWYRIVAIPLAWVYLKLKFRHKIIGREKIKAANKQGRFVFGNHTQIIADALIPSFVDLPKGPYVIVHANNVSMRFLGRINQYLGALPLPDDMEATRNFTDIIKKRINDKKAVFIYPEAHIWPYYTGIRPFRDDSFIYPVKHGTAVFCFTNTYQKRKLSKKPRIITYIDGPFYPDASRSPREQRKELRDKVYSTMLERAKLSNCIMVEYKKYNEDNI